MVNPLAKIRSLKISGWLRNAKLTIIMMLILSGIISLSAAFGKIIQIPIPTNAKMGITLIWLTIVGISCRFLYRVLNKAMMNDC